MEHKQEEIDKFIELAHNYHLTIKFMTEIADTQLSWIHVYIHVRAIHVDLRRNPYLTCAYTSN